MDRTSVERSFFAECPTSRVCNVMIALACDAVEAKARNTHCLVFVQQARVNRHVTLPVGSLYLYQMGFMYVSLKWSCIVTLVILSLLDEVVYAYADLDQDGVLDHGHAATNHHDDLKSWWMMILKRTEN
jgi:hypothetical protein